MKARRLTLVILLFCVGFSMTSLSAQEYLNGKLIDANVGDVIPFATIRIKNKTVGVISNDDGSFKIPVQFKEIGDTLEVSSLGYRSKEVLLSTLKLDETNIILLVPEIEKLNEVVVTSERNRASEGLRANEIVRKALEGIAENFPHHPFSYVGYYRDYQVWGEDYVNLNEGVLSVYDQGFGYNDYKSTQGELYAYKENNEFPRNLEAQRPYDDKNKRIGNASLKGYGGNEFSILRAHDAIRNYNVRSYSYVQNFMQNFENNHRFIREADVSFDGEPLYALRILTSKKEYKAEGKIYIFKKNFAIHRMEYALFKVLPKKGSRLERKKPIFDVTVEYQEERGQMYLNYISFNNTFSFVKESPFQIVQYLVDKKKRCLIVEFTNEPALPLGLRSSKYQVTYQGKRLNWDQIKIEGKQVLLYPKLTAGKTFEETFISGKGDEQDYKFKIKTMYDIHGNKLHKREVITANQLREFFVQELRFDHKVSEGAAFFDKDQPLSKAPISKQKANSYWMNTPLKKTTN
ncbi:carboxypeptidase-like regulatory domain-containing protein [Spongiimicrobium salis]|uniref:carboxypeptidase-like regulatory domain-containing protein n=1 Tax=Spongiimicrobium salis TaxID=1667022 RepID=UPI00374D1AD1